MSEPSGPAPRRMMMFVATIFVIGIALAVAYVLLSSPGEVQSGAAPAIGRTA